MEVYLSAGCRVSSRTACGDDRIQDSAGALGQRPDSDGKENSSACAQKRPAVSRETRGVVSPHRELELSAHGDFVSSAFAGHGDPLLPGLVSDAVHRHSTLPGIDVFDFKLLSCLAT